MSETVVIGECCEDDILTIGNAQPEWWHNGESEPCDRCGEVAESIAFVAKRVEYHA